MKEHLRQIVEDAGTPQMRTCIAREYLQARVLESLQESGAFARWAFVGGTALRFLYAIPRFSEDLDFSLLHREAESGFHRSLTETRHALAREGYRIEIRVKEQHAVSSAWIRFPGLPHELGLSPHPSQTLSIKTELDTNPPEGAGIETSIVRRHVTLHLCHYDRPSLFAGKLHAVLMRKWTKGRDLFDLAWYLADPLWPAPNLALLNAALIQTGWSAPPLTTTDWREAVRERLDTVDWERARADIRPFLARERDLDLVSKAALLRLLARQ